MNNENSLLNSERGFTLIELLVTIAILSILAGLSVTSYILYKEKAEYSKGSATLHNVRTAFSVGELDLPEGFSLAYTESATVGGDLVGPLAQVLPGANTPGGIRVGVEVSACTETSSPLDRAAFIVSEPCLGKEQLRWQKFCGGIEVLMEHVSNASPCT